MRISDWSSDVCSSDLLADFGAEVIKVEQIEGDPVRAMGKRANGKSLYAASIMRNKKLVALDLKSPRGQDLVKKLVANCDIVVENFRPKTLERWGLGYEDLKAINPRIIMVRVTGFGQDGPYSSRPGRSEEHTSELQSLMRISYAVFGL